jgi:SAM-dependent methyltransferase
MTDGLDPSFWEERYRSGAERVGGRRPNPQLVAEVGDVAPATALDAGCGEGSDAVWLASRGFRVTAVDVSPTALGRARELAAACGPEVAGRIAWVEADLTSFTPEGLFDLVVACYVHVAGPADELHRRLAAAVAPGGTLLVVGHHPSDPHSHAHADVPGVQVTPEEVAAVLLPEDWDVAVAEARTRRVDHDGREVVFCDVVVRARRRPQSAPTGTP